MRYLGLFIVLFVFLGAKPVVSMASEHQVAVVNQVEAGISNPQPIKSWLFKLKGKKENVKITAAILALTLGPLGVHRLYLGTSPVIPVAYVLTLGGGLYILPFIDFVVIVFSKDITPYIDNNRFFMWVNKKDLNN